MLRYMSLITLSVVTSVKCRLNWQYQDVSGSLPHAHVKSLSQVTPGPCTASKNEYFGHFRTVPGRDNFNNPYGRRCVEEAAPNSPGVFIKPVARKQLVEDPEGRIWGPPGYRPVNGRAPRDCFCRFS